MKLAIYKTLLGFAALSILVGGFWVGFDLARDYVFNVHNFMITLTSILVIPACYFIGGYFVKE